MTEEKWYPSFNPKDFPACHDHAQAALQLAKQALRGTSGAAPQNEALLQKELAYAEAQAARFANGTAMQPKRNAAQQRYSELMEGIGAALPCPLALAEIHFDINSLP